MPFMTVIINNRETGQSSTDKMGALARMKAWAAGTVK